jgi:hypothetical protein
MGGHLAAKNSVEQYRQVSTDYPGGMCIAQNDGRALVATGEVGLWSRNRVGSTAKKGAGLRP